MPNVKRMETLMEDDVSNANYPARKKTPPVQLEVLNGCSQSLVGLTFTASKFPCPTRITLETHAPVVLQPSGKTPASFQGHLRRMIMWLVANNIYKFRSENR